MAACLLKNNMGWQCPKGTDRLFRDKLFLTSENSLLGTVDF